MGISFKLTAILIILYSEFYLETIFVESLKVAGTEEGACINPLPDPVENFNLTWFKTISTWYVPGGSKYFYFKSATAYKDFANIREFQLYYFLCPVREQQFENGQLIGSTTYGFGSNIGSYTISLSSSGVFNMSTQPPFLTQEEFIAIPILTDNESFVLFYKCWTEIDQKSWFLMTTSDVISKNLQALIDDKSMSTGFAREKFEFLRYNSCAKQVGNYTGWTANK